MKKTPGFLYRIFLMFGDSLAIIFAFAFAYFFRTHIDSRPFFFETEILGFIASNALLVPIWLILLSLLGLYSKSVISSKVRETTRALTASVIGIMFIITYDFLLDINLFPVRTIAVYSAIFCFAFLLLFRGLVSIARRYFFRHHYGLTKVVLIGNNENTTQLLNSVSHETGFEIIGVVARNEFIPTDWRGKKYRSVQEAVKENAPDAIIYTGNKDTEKYNQVAINCHALYYYVPNDHSLISYTGEMELIAATPAVLVKTTPLTGGARLFKRTSDIVLSLLLLILATPFMIIIFIIQKILDPKAPAIYPGVRLTRFNKKFKLYKFRSIMPEYSNMIAEDAFEKMGRPELSSGYRANGDYLEDDPRYTQFGLFLRKTSLDELPQLLNVLKGEISLIGPRALMPNELRDYGEKGLLLSVKSGLTGLAQVSGRRDISFDERRALDIYYVQNWTPLLDLQILFRTISSVLFRRGAK